MGASPQPQWDTGDLQIVAIRSQKYAVCVRVKLLALFLILSTAAAGASPQPQWDTGDPQIVAIRSQK